MSGATRPASFLEEDIGEGDITTSALVPPGARCRARILARQELVLAGTSLAGSVFRSLDPDLDLDLPHGDGDRLEPGGTVLSIEGSAVSVLTAERAALNCLGHLSGIATLTARFVAAVEGLPCRILDTRKTLPGLRREQKRAVRAGGGENHRMDLAGMALVKDNHLMALDGPMASRIAHAVERIRARYPGKRVEVEADCLDQVRAALDAGADRILLDNMPLPLLRRAVETVAGRIATEASGRIGLDTVRQVAECGVDFISVGALTHSAPVADLSLELEPVR